MFDWTSVMAKARRVVHSTFQVEVQYQAPGGIVPPVTLHVRWHDRIALVGNVVDAGYADVLEGVDRIIFNREELVEIGVVLGRGGKVTFGPAFQNTVLNLDSMEPTEGPINVVWKVAR